MTFRLMACLTLALTVFASSVIAQDEGRGQRGGRGGQQGGGGPGGQGGRGFGGFGGGMGMRLGSGAGSILSMLETAEVRKEVGVTDEAYEPVGKMIAEYRQKRMSRDASEEERKKATDEYNAKAQDILDELLAPAKLKRLKGLYAQQNQAAAVTNTVIAKEIGVSETVRTEIEKGLQEQFTKLMESFRPGGNGGNAGAGGGGGREGMAKIQEDANKLVDSKLNAEQKKALEELKGEKFEFPQRTFGGGQGGGGQGGQGGRPRGDGN